MPPNVVKASTLGVYLLSFLVFLGEQQKGFNSKRPFNHTDWEHPIFTALIHAGYLTPQVDEDANVDFLNEEQVEKGRSLIVEAIEALLAPLQNPELTSDGH